MAGGKAGIFVLALALGLGGQAALAARIVNPASARLAITSPAVAATDAELAALAAAGRATELAARLDLIANDGTINAVAREWLLDRGLHALAALAPTTRSRATVLRLSSRSPVVYTRIDPDHGDRVTPLYDVGATARFVLRTWERNAARDAARADLLAARTSVVDRFAALDGTHPARAGIADAFRAGAVRHLTHQQAGVANSLARGGRVDELALVLAERLKDAEMFRLVLSHADATVALAAVSSIGRALDPHVAFDELARASRRAEVASAAILAIGSLARSDAAARRFLLDAIGEPDIGPSSAAALADVDDPALSAELGRRLLESRTEESRRLYVLALKLDASAGARAALERFAAANTGSTELQREVRQWLSR